MLTQLARAEFRAALRAGLEHFLAPAEPTAEAIGLGEHEGGPE